MKRDERLSDQDLWQPDGHLSELALTAFGDGERALLSEAARAHADACDACSARLGQLALLSLSMTEALAEDAPLPLGAPAPFPFWTVAVGLVVAGVGALPVIWDLSVYDLVRSFTRTAPVALRVASSLVKAASNAGPALLVVWVAATLVLGSMGFLVARAAPRRTEWKGARA